MNTKKPGFYFALLILGVLSASSSFIFIRESTEAPVMLAAYRLLLTVVLLIPIFILDFKKHSHGLKSLIGSALLPGLLLALHFISWIIGARMTPAANATLIVNLVPLVMPVFMFLLYQEEINQKETMATILAFIGLLILSVSDFSTRLEYLWGDLICFLSMLLFGFYLALARKSAKYDSIWLYLVPMYFVAGIICFALALFFSSPIHAYSQKDIYMIIGLTIIPTIIGHSAINLSMQKFRGQTVSIMTMGQFIFAAFFGVILYDEIPTAAFYAAVLVFSLSLLLIIRRSNKTNGCS